VLGTPLALNLLRRAYVEAGDPRELFDVARFPAPDAVHQHLIGTILPVAYPDRAELARVEPFLIWIARQMLHRHTRDLAWWRIRFWGRPWIPPVVSTLLFGSGGAAVGALAGGTTSGIAFGLAWILAGGTTGAAVVAGGARRRRQASGVLPRLLAAVSVGITFGAGVVVVGRLASGSLPGMTAALLLGAAFGAVNGLAVGFLGLHDGPLIGRIRWPGRREVGAGLAAAGVGGVVVSLVAGGVLGSFVAAVACVGFSVTYAWTRPSPNPQSEASPRASYESDLRGAALFSVIGGIFTGAGFGLGTLPILGIGRSLTLGAAAAVLTGAAGAVASSQAVALWIATAGVPLRHARPVRPMRRLIDAYDRQVLRPIGCR
jgi:hypothetical protein